MHRNQFTGRSLRVIVVVITLSALTGCWSLRSFTSFRCPCAPPLVPSSPVAPAQE